MVLTHGAGSQWNSGHRSVALRATVSGRTTLAGQSYGGRQASMLAAEEPELVEGLLLTVVEGAWHDLKRQV